MLQQILREMWVDPEILAELDEAQKQTLFCKMREEQVRRWQQWDQKVNNDVTDRPKVQKTSSVKKQVQFLQGEDGEPWVWVMGEHKEDKSIETMLAEEAKKKAVEQARKEAHQLRKSVEKELTHLIDDYKPLDSIEQKFDLSQKSVDSLEDTLEIYCTVDELRHRIQDLEPEVKMPDESEEGSSDSLEDKTEYRNEKNLKMEVNKNTLHFNFIEGKEAYQELGIPCGGGGGGGVGVRVAAWERRVAAARASDILRGLRARRARCLRHAERSARDGERAWREQERKAKEAEAAMREIARAAREEHRRSSVMEAPIVEPCVTEGGSPPSKEAVIEWFRTYETKRGAGLDENNKPAIWFHGLITRTESESLLPNQIGCFLVRLSSRVYGYAISLRAPEPAPARCKHFLVESVDGKYRLLGAKQRMHASLVDLIEYHKTIPITEAGQEFLITPCVPAQTPAILTASALTS